MEMNLRWIYPLGFMLLCLSHEAAAQEHSLRISKREVKEALTYSRRVSVFFTCNVDASLSFEDSDIVFNTNSPADTCERYLAWFINPGMSFGVLTVVNGTEVNNTFKESNDHLAVVKKGKDIFIEHSIDGQVVELFRVISLVTAVNKDDLSTDYTLTVRRIGVDLGAE